MHEEFTEIVAKIAAAGADLSRVSPYPNYITSVDILAKLKEHGVHRWDLPVLHYHEIMVIYPYPFLVVITQLFSCIIFINDCICILTGSPR